MHFLIWVIILWLSLCAPAQGSYFIGEEQLQAEGADFSWLEVQSKTLRIVIEYQDDSGAWKQTSSGSGFLISPEGLFVTAYHVVKYCLHGQKHASRFGVALECASERPRMRYKAHSGDRAFGIEILSHLKEADATSGKDIHTPDEIIKHRDFVIGRLKAPPGTRFPYWKLRDFAEGTINLKDPRADFELKPLFPPKKVFVAGFPKGRDLEIAHGFLNLADENHRGYFAVDFPVYPSAYLMRTGISPDTRWGLGVENHMSGGPVLDASGRVIGLVVNGNQSMAGVISIENVLETFFSRSKTSDRAPAIRLLPTDTLLYLREKPSL